MRAVQPRQPLVRVPVLQKQRCVRDWYTTHVAPAASQKLVQSARLPPWLAGQFLSDWPPEQWVWSAPLKLPHVVRGRVGAGVVNETNPVKSNTVGDSLQLREQPLERIRLVV